jgi:hypothetical protein
MTDVGPADRDDAALLAAAAAGDEQAFATFYRRHLAAITGFHLRRTGRREIAFDPHRGDLRGRRRGMR